MSDKINVLIVDDEFLARKELKVLLKNYDIISIVGEAENSKEAQEMILKYQPDCIFLDIQMPGESGIEMISKIETEAKIIFVTAYDEFAIRAFEMNALDYLTKPVYPPRLEKTIQRIIDSSNSKIINNSKLNYEDHLFIRLTKKMFFIGIESIVFINSAKEYTEVYTNDGKKGLVDKTMNEWETRLPENHFTRIHRSTIINLQYIRDIEEYTNNSYKIYLKGFAEPLIMSNRYSKKIKDKFK